MQRLVQLVSGVLPSFFPRLLGEAALPMHDSTVENLIWYYTRRRPSRRIASYRIVSYRMVSYGARIVRVGKRSTTQQRNAAARSLSDTLSYPPEDATGAAPFRSSSSSSSCFAFSAFSTSFTIFSVFFSSLRFSSHSPRMLAVFLPFYLFFSLFLIQAFFRAEYATN